MATVMFGGVARETRPTGTLALNSISLEKKKHSGGLKY
jgi:hypothetical protein